MRRSRGYQLFNKNIGIVGFGSIGKEIAHIAKGYEMNVNCIVSNYSESRKRKLVKDGVYIVKNIEELAKGNDILVVCCPLTNETKNLITKDILDLLGPQSILVNVARGGVVSETDLYDSLYDNKIFGAASDVFEQEEN
ncbi:NAD(P)-dependent oxidoreductase [Vibrio sp. PP-XX7]